MDTRQLILYRDLKDQSLFDGMTSLLTNGGQQDEGAGPNSYILASQLIRRRIMGLRAIFGAVSWRLSLPAMRMRTVSPVRSAGIREEPCPGWRDRIWR